MNGFKRNVDGYYDVADQLPRYLRGMADQQLAAGNKERQEFRSRTALESHSTRMRSAFFEVLGGLPDERTDLNPECTGTLEREGYTIEKIVFESRPSFHVTTNCYLPDGVDRMGEVPGVLFFCGHADVGKAAGLYQQACIDLARDGFCVLSVDPLGQGERHQFYDPETGDAPRRNIHEHSYIGHQCALAGENVANYFVWDCIRSLDYLASRPEVDDDRIGATGNSGGGLQTAYLMLADDRLAAAMPCCFITAKEDYMKTGQAQDAEQILYKAIERGPRYDDFLTAFAPRPVRIGAAQSDFLCIEGAHHSYERAQEAYALFDATEAIDLVDSPGTHGLSETLRESMVNWFRLHLRGDEPVFETTDPEIESPETLQCLSDGEVNAAFPGERNVIDFTRDRVRARDPEAPAAVDGPYSTAMRERVRDRFDLDRETCRPFPRSIEREEDRALVWEKVFFRSEPDIVTTGIVARTSREDDVSEPTIVLLDRGTNEIDAYRSDVSELAHEKGFVLVFDPRGVGGVRARDVNTPLANGAEYYETHGTEYKLASDALMCGTSLVALRVFDLLRAGEYLRNRCDATELGIVGAGTGAIHALYGAVADPSFRSIRVENVPAFHERATERRVAPQTGRSEAPRAASKTKHDHGLKMNGVVGECDIPQLLPALADRDIEVTPFPENGIP